jgi:hypothetical protein
MVKKRREVFDVGVSFRRRDILRGAPVSAGNGKSESNNEVESGKDLETKLRTEGATGTFEMPFLGVESLKTLSSSCS